MLLAAIIVSIGGNSRLMHGLGILEACVQKIKEFCQD